MMASSLNLDRLMSVSSFEEQTNFKARRFQGSRSTGLLPGHPEVLEGRLSSIV
jgi:hypothetical protein